MILAPDEAYDTDHHQARRARAVAGVLSMPRYADAEFDAAAALAQATPSEPKAAPKAEPPAVMAVLGRETLDSLRKCLDDVMPVLRRGQQDGSTPQARKADADMLARIYEAVKCISRPPDAHGMCTFARIEIESLRHLLSDLDRRLVRYERSKSIMARNHARDLRTRVQRVWPRLFPAPLPAGARNPRT